MHILFFGLLFFALLVFGFSNRSTEPDAGAYADGAGAGSLHRAPFSAPVPPMSRSFRLPSAGQRTVSGYGSLNNPRTLRCVPAGISLDALLTSMIQQESGGNPLAAGYDWKPNKNIFFGVSVGTLQELELKKWVFDQARYEQVRARAVYIPGANDYHAEGSLQPASDTRDAGGNSLTVLTREGVGVQLTNSNRLYRGVARYLGTAGSTPYNVYDLTSQARVALGELFIDKGLMRNAYWAVVHYNGSGSFAENYANQVLGRILTPQQISCLRNYGH